MNKLVLVRNFSWILLAVAGIYLGQGCSGGGSQPVQFRGTAAASAGGDGQPFDHKPGIGTYERHVPGFTCGGQARVQSQIEVKADGAVLTTLDPANCQSAVQPVNLAIAASSSFNPSVLGYQDGLFVKKSGAPIAQIPEVLCRVQSSATSAMEVLIVFDKDTRRLTAAVSASRLQNGVWMSSPTMTADVGRETLTNAVLYASPGFNLRVSAGVTAAGTRPGNLQVTYAGQNYEDPAAECRVGALFDDKAPLKPGLSLDFASGVLPANLNYQRTGPATYFNDGLIALAPAGIPRFDRDPVTNEPLGLMIEESRSNYFRDSTNLASGNWIYDGLLVVSEGQLAGLPRFRIEQNNPADLSPFHRVAQMVMTPPGQLYTASFFVERGTADMAYILVYQWEGGAGEAQVNFNLANGTAAVSHANSVTIRDYKIRPLRRGYRISMTFNVTGTRMDVGVGLLPATLGANIYATAAQLETGYGATSFIPTTTGEVTRGEEQISFTNTTWMNAAGGTFELNAHRPPFRYGSAVELLGIAGSGSDRYTMAADGAEVASLTASVGGTTTSASVNSPVVPAWGAQQYLFSYSDQPLSLYSAGNVTQAPTALPALAPASIRIGGPSGAKWNGHLRSLTYWPVRASNLELGLMGN